LQDHLTFSVGEQVDHASVVVGQSPSGSSLLAFDVKAPAAAADERVSEVAVEGDDHEVVSIGVVGDDGVCGVGQTDLTYTPHGMAVPVQELSHRLDHVLVGEEP
jgi:hypothetical protein